MTLRHLQVSLVVVFVAASAARADSVLLIESIKPDDAFKISLSMKLNGEMVVVQGGKTSNLKLTASAEHRFRERVLAVQSSGLLPTKVARYYDDARAVITVDAALTPARCVLIVDSSSPNGRATGSSAIRPQDRSPAKRLDTVSEHFDTLALTGLLPGKSVAIGYTWQISEPVVQALCQFDGLVSHELSSASSAKSKTGNGTHHGVRLRQRDRVGAQVAVKITGLPPVSI